MPHNKYSAEELPQENRLSRSARKKSQKRAKEQQKRDLKRQKRQELKGKKGAPKKRAKKVVKRVMIAGTVFTLLGVSGACTAGAYAWNQYGDMVQASVTKGYEIAETVNETDFVTKSPTKIVDRNGDVLKTFKEFQYETPEYDAINPMFVEALVSAEDERFYEHHGVDLYGTMRGIFMTVKGNGVQGGSTITQQLVRNVILEDATQSVERKLIEQVVSQEVEKKMEKSEIVRHYLNNVYFGNGNYGIAPASRYYFSKDQKDIELHEAATIIGITNNPSLFDPITKPENALNKRNRVLGKMLEVGTITQSQHDEAVKQPLEVQVTKHGIDNSVTEPALGYAVHKATEHLMEANGFVFQTVFADNDARKAYKTAYHEEFMKVRQSILNGGYFIETSIDTDKQRKLEQVVATTMAPYYGKDDKTGFYRLQTAMTTVDNETGEVVAIVGGRGENGNVFNRGYQGVRQPGSTIKPLVAYTPAFEKGYTPESKMEDSAVKNGPKNVYNGYMGTVTLRYATEISINTIAYKLANQIGGDAMIGKLSKMNFSSLSPGDANPIIAVGGFTNGVTTVEMASGYGTVANQGIYRDPSNVRLIRDIVTDEVLFERPNEKRKVYDSGASYLMVDTLKSVMKNGSGKRAMPDNYPHVIGKTGTTNANKDIWFVGGTPHYTTAVWTGYDTPGGLPEYERLVAGTLFKNWNEELHKGKKVKDFARPDTVWKKNGRWVAKVNQVEREREQRRLADKQRMIAEQASQRERLAKEDYRIQHGLTYEEEMEREAKVEAALEAFYKAPFDQLEQYEEQRQMLLEIEPLLEEVKSQQAYNRLSANWQASMARIDAKRDAFIAEIERARLEEERLRKEAEAAEEAARLAEERRIQDELELERQAEIEAQEQAEAEAQRLEDEANQAEEELEESEESTDTRPEVFPIPGDSDNSGEQVTETP